MNIESNQSSMKKQYVRLIFTIALTMNAPAGQGSVEQIAINQGASEEVVEPGQKPSENTNSRESWYSDAGSWEIGGAMAVSTNKSADGSTYNALGIAPVLIFSRPAYIFRADCGLFRKMGRFN